MRLTPAQEKALKKVTKEWKSAYELECGLSTLEILYNKGMILKKTGLGSMFSPRTSILWRLK